MMINSDRLLVLLSSLSIVLITAFLSQLFYYDESCYYDGSS